MVRKAFLVSVLVMGCKGAGHPLPATGTGLKPCDDYIALVRTCADKHQDEGTRTHMHQGADKMEADLRHADFAGTPDSDQDKKDMIEICASSLRGESPVIGWCDPNNPATYADK